METVDNALGRDGSATELHAPTHDDQERRRTTHVMFRSEETVVLSVVMPPRLADQLIADAARRRVSPGQVIRNAIEVYLSHERTPPRRL